MMPEKNENNFSYGRKVESCKKVIIAVESSCDDTAMAIITLEGDIIFEHIFSQDDMHSGYGGVVPELASRNHLMAFQSIIEICREKGIFNENEVVATAATAGPGLIGGLIVGVMLAKGMAQALKTPFIAINHLEGHLLSPMISNSQFTFPFLSLLISGGHCEMIEATALGEYNVLGRTADDAAGEAFDKAARLLGFGYPGGRKIEEYAKHGNARAFALPIAKMKSMYDFSFSGLKTAILMHTRNLQKNGQEITLQQKYDLAASLQNTIANTIYKNLEKAIVHFKENIGGNRLAICGGVAANGEIRQVIDELCEKYSMQPFIPPIKYCTDNAAMIAVAALQRYKHNIFNSLDFAPRPVWPLEEIGNV